MKPPGTASWPRFPHVRSGAKPLQMKRKAWFSLNDLRDFLMAYCACFMAVSLYIA